MRSLCFLLLCFLAVPLSAQRFCEARLDSQRVETGNAFVVHLAVTYGVQQPGEPDWSYWNKALPQENVLSRGEWIQESGGGWTRDVTLITFDTGSLAIPPLRLYLPDGDPCETAALQVEVYATPASDDPADLAEIKDIHRQPGSWLDYLPYFAIPILLLVLAVFVYYLWQMFVKKDMREVATPPLPPHEWALRQLSALESEQLYQKGEVAEYYTGISHIVRTYIQRQLNIPALKDTLNAWLPVLPETLQEETRDMLEVCDLAKFARHQPPAELHPEMLERARALVLALQPREKTEEEES